MADHGGSFPHPEYARVVLRPQFAASREHVFETMLEANAAHAVMLARCGILSPDDAAALIGGLDLIRAEGVEAFQYEPEVEDLFFAVEGRLIALAGERAGGNLQIARSRNDLAAGLSRMAFRDAVNRVRTSVLRLREVVIGLAGEHVETIMQGITHTQPAQPTTLGHYLLGVLGPLERDSQRLAEAYRRINRSPLGVAAFTTTSFPIDRELTARLLGFDGLIENGYDAVGGGDYLLDALTPATICVASLSRFVHDLLVWARKDVGILRIDDAFIQVSSIMPQKRNPVVLEHIRTRIGWVYGAANAVETILHSSAFGDTNDVEDPAHIPVHAGLRATCMVLDLLAAVLETAAFDVKRLARDAGVDHATTTALADLLVRAAGLPFRTAHRVVSRLVTITGRTGEPITAELVNAQVREAAGEGIALTDAQVTDALHAWSFVRHRSLPGGPAPDTVRAAIDEARLRLDDDRTTLDTDLSHVRQAHGVLMKECASVTHRSAGSVRKTNARFNG